MAVTTEANYWQRSQASHQAVAENENSRHDSDILLIRHLDITTLSSPVRLSPSRLFSLPSRVFCR